MSADNRQRRESQSDGDTEAEEPFEQAQQTDVDSLQEMKEESVARCLKCLERIETSPSPLLSTNEVFTSLNAIPDSPLRQQCLNLFFDKCAEQMENNICVIWIVQNSGVEKKTHHPKPLQADQKLLDGKTGFITINRGRKQYSWLYQGDLNGVYNQIFDSKDEQQIIPKLEAFCTKKTDEEINAATLNETTNNDTQTTVPGGVTFGDTLTAESPPTIQSSHETDNGDEKNKAFDTYLVAHNISTWNEGGPPMVESSRHLSIVVDIAGGHTEQDLDGYQIQLVKEHGKPRYLIVLKRPITKLRQYYNKVYYIGNCRVLMEELAGTTSNGEDLALKSQGCLDDLATKRFDDLKSKNKVMGTDAESLWTGTVNCQTYAKALVEDLRCEWPGKVIVFAENCIIANAIIHVKRETDNTSST